MATGAARRTLRLHKRLAFSVLCCGKKKVWLDLNETNGLSNANFNQQIWKLIKDRLIIHKLVSVHSGAPCQNNTLARQRHRHVDI
ncbi:Hypothetical predicted protein, partial [Marmota monax]